MLQGKDNSSLVNSQYNIKNILDLTPADKSKASYFKIEGWRNTMHDIDN